MTNLKRRDGYQFNTSVQWCWDGMKIVGMPDVQCWRSNTTTWFVSGSCTTQAVNRADGTWRGTGTGIYNQCYTPVYCLTDQPVINIIVKKDGSYTYLADRFSISRLCRSVTSLAG